MCQCTTSSWPAPLHPVSGWDELIRACFGRTSGPVTSLGMTAQFSCARSRTAKMHSGMTAQLQTVHRCMTTPVHSGMTARWT